MIFIFILNILKSSGQNKKKKFSWTCYNGEW